MRWSRNPYLVLALFVGVFYLLILAGRSGDTVARVALWGLLLAMSVGAVVKMVRRRHVAPYGQDVTLGKRWRRWVLDEPESKEKHSHPR